MFYDAVKHEFKLEENCGINGQSPAACICLASPLQQAKTTVADPPVRRPSLIISPLVFCFLNPAK